MSEDELRDLLDMEAARINSPSFISGDPVQFPRRFSSLPDIELAAILSATIAWGNRKMICRDCDRLLALMENSPHRFMMERGYEDLRDEENVHRTFFCRHLRHFLGALRPVYERYGSLLEYARHLHIEASEAPAWALAEGINAALAAGAPEGAEGRALSSRCLPQNLRTTALKRLNMALRWLVRRDGIVDLGVWEVITPAQLYIPLDVHVGDVSRELGLLTRRSDDRRAVEELTGALRRFRPDDPALYDFALFGIGMRL